MIRASWRRLRRQHLEEHLVLTLLSVMPNITPMVMHQHVGEALLARLDRFRTSSVRRTSPRREAIQNARPQK